MKDIVNLVQKYYTIYVTVVLSYMTSVIQKNGGISMVKKPQPNIDSARSSIRCCYR